MIPIKFKIIFFLLLLNLNSFCQTKYDTAFIRKIINIELKERDKKMKKAYPIFQKSSFKNENIKYDTLYVNYYLGKEINWLDLNLETKFGFYTNDKLVDTCFYIYAPKFNSDLNKFYIKFETRFLDNTSYFSNYYFSKKRKKWKFEKEFRSFTF